MKFRFQLLTIFYLTLAFTQSLSIKEASNVKNSQIIYYPAFTYYPSTGYCFTGETTEADTVSTVSVNNSSIKPQEPSTEKNFAAAGLVKTSTTTGVPGPYSQYSTYTIQADKKAPVAKKQDAKRVQQNQQGPTPDQLEKMKNDLKKLIIQVYGSYENFNAQELDKLVQTNGQEMANTCKKLMIKQMNDFINKSPASQ